MPRGTPVAALSRDGKVLIALPATSQRDRPPPCGWPTYWVNPSGHPVTRSQV